MFPIIKNEKLLFLIALVVILLFFGFLLYNVNSTKQYTESFLRYNYYQDAELEEYLNEKIDNEIRDIVEEKMNSNELSAMILFNKSASRIDSFVNILGVVTVIIFLSIGILIWASTKDRDESRKLLEEMKEIVKDIKGMRKKAKALVDQISYKDTADRFNKRFRNIKFFNKNK